DLGFEPPGKTSLPPDHAVFRHGSDLDQNHRDGGSVGAALGRPKAKTENPTARIRGTRIRSSTAIATYPKRPAFGSRMSARMKRNMISQSARSTPGAAVGSFDMSSEIRMAISMKSRTASP